MKLQRKTVIIVNGPCSVGIYWDTTHFRRLFFFSLHRLLLLSFLSVKNTNIPIFFSPLLNSLSSPSRAGIYWDKIPAAAAAASDWIISALEKYCVPANILSFVLSIGTQYQLPCEFIRMLVTPQHNDLDWRLCSLGFVKKIKKKIMELKTRNGKQPSWVAHTEKFLYILSLVVRYQALTYRTLVGLGGGGSLVIHGRKHDVGSFYRRNKFTQLCF